MERYQETLNKLKNMGDKDLYNERHLEWAKTLQELVDILKEYNVTQSNIRKILLAGNQFKHLIDKANKYDDKETPKKFKIKTDKDGRTIWVCPNCGDVLMKFWSDVETISPRKYCDECGTALDWSAIHE